MRILVLFLVLFFGGCVTVPEPASKVESVSNDVVAKYCAQPKAARVSFHAAWTTAIAAAAGLPFIENLPYLIQCGD